MMMFLPRSVVLAVSLAAAVLLMAKTATAAAYNPRSSPIKGLAKRNLTNTKQHRKENDPNYHSLFAPCATSVKAYCSVNNFQAPPVSLPSSNGVFTILQDTLLLADSHRDNDDNIGNSHASSFCNFVVKNENLKGIRSRMGKVLPTCRQLHTNDPSICVAVNNKVPLPALPIQSNRRQRIIYEMHLSTFSPDGTFDGAVTRLLYLVELGITTIQLMPVNVDFDSSWGYSTAHLFAVKSELGGYGGLKRFIEAAHDAGLEVYMDVVYNHASARTLLYDRYNQCEADDGKKNLKNSSLPPATYCPSNIFKEKVSCLFGDYFYNNEDQTTPWGPRFNYSSDQVLSYLRSNVKYWVEELGIDGLRFDSTICIRRSRGSKNECWQPDAIPNEDGANFLRESTEYLSRMNRFSIAEDLQNDPLVTSTSDSGLGFDAQWGNDLFYVFREALRHKDKKSLVDVLNVIEGRCDPKNGEWISYTETHDIASSQVDGQSRTAAVVDDLVLDESLLQRAKILPIALALVSCGTPMIFQGQELGEKASFDYFHPPPHDWEGFGVDWPAGLDLKATVKTPLCDMKSSLTEKRKAFLSTKALLQIFSREHEYFFVGAGQDKLPSAAAFDFELEDALGGKLLGVLNFDETAIDSSSFSVPTPGIWKVAYNSANSDSDDVSHLQLQTRTFGDVHYIESFTIPPLATILLEPVGEDFEPDSSSSPQSQKCMPSFLHSIQKSDNLKFFNQTYWINHVSLDLYPFWSSSDALGGDEYGNFPTYRCNDGSAYDKEINQCKEIESAPEWITDYTDYDIAVQHSRQIFFYSVAYHMTGNSEMLEHAKAGIDVFFSKFVDGNKGAICTYFSKDSHLCLPAENERTSMEHANALIGLAMYFYITRDEAVGDFIFKSADYTFSNWYREDWYMMGMANKTSAKPSVPVLEGEPLEVRKDMLAQLDQLNAYLMILRGLSRKSEQWDNRMLDLALALKGSFWNEKYNIMWGNSNYEVLSSVHSDFGHSQKCLWFIMMTAEHLNDKELYKWAYTRAMRMIPLAFLPRKLFHNVTDGDVGTWAFDRDDSGASNSGHVWWVYAELSQTAAFMSVSNPSIASAVTSKAYSAYINLFLDVDSPQKGVFHWKDYLTHETLFAKGHVWKNGFHEAEHALVASISSAALQEQELRLYYAPENNSPSSNVFYPGFFKGTIAKKVTFDNDADMLANHTKVAIDWSELRSTDNHPDPLCLGVSCSGNGICLKGQCLCLHGWTGPKCDVNPCQENLLITTSKRNCDTCTVTFKLNPSTIIPHPISKVMLAGSFSNWSAVEMELEQHDESSDSLYSELYPQASFYHGFSSSKMYSVDIDIPNGQHHTYKFVLDDSTWTYDKCNPDAVPDGLVTADGIESKDLNSKLYVSCPPSGPTCELAKKVRDDMYSQSINEEVNREEDQKVEYNNDVDSGTVVQLFEWNFESVAKECKRLGEEGWTAVQLSPVNAHMHLGPNIVENYDSADFPLPPIYPWWERYQQASFNVISRSGNEAELKAVTEICSHYGVQVWVEVTLNSMNAAPCCDIPQSLTSELPTCDNFFIDDSKSCSAQRIFPTAGFDAGDFHSPPCGIGDIGTWGSPDVTHNCDMTGLPDLDTSSDHVQKKLAKYLDHLLDLGVSGFRLLAVGHIDSKEVEEILGRSKNRIRQDVFEMTKARSMLPTLIVDLWPSWLVRYPHLQPSFYPDSMTPFTYNELSSSSFNTDLAWSFTVGDTFYNKAESPTLANLTYLSVSTRFSHPMYKQKTDRIPLEGLILQLTNHFLTFYGVENCTSTIGTTDIRGNFHENVCPNVLSATWDEHLFELGSIWMMSLPVGFTRIHSSYDWQRSYITNEYGRPFDTLFSSGPPRTYDGGTQSVNCDAANKPGHDLSPAFVEDGLRWMCEHRRAGIAAMPKWRKEVAKAGAYQLKLNEWIGNREVNNLFVSISRSVRQGSNQPLKGGWVAINAHSTDTVTKQFATRLPAGTYRNGAGGGEDTFVVDSRGILEATLRPLESIIIHTGDMTASKGVSISASTIFFIIFLWLLLPFVGCVGISRIFSKEKDIILKDNASCAIPENGHKISLSGANVHCKDEETLILNEFNKTRAMICTLEHIVPETALSGKINQKVGGLGKVMEVVSKFHPGELIMVTPMMGGVSYPVMREAEPVSCEVEGKVEEVQIFHFCWPREDQKVESILCKHDGLFGKRTDKDKELYPDDSEGLDYFLRFFTLWNQTVAKLALRHRKSLDVLHLCDYHTSIAPTYMKREDENINTPILCTLHNASYQGSIQNHLSSKLLGHISKISGIPEEVISRDFTHDGQFNMLSGLVSYFRKEQKGRGFCAVSKRYAKEIPILLDCFRAGMLKVRSLPNPELSINRPSSLEGMTSADEIRAIKKIKKHELQNDFDLEVNPNAIIGAFVGRMVYQKGVDAIADAATELLLRYDNLQLIVVGPPGDIFGEYAAARLINIAQSSLFKGRVFVIPKFYKFTPDHRLGCDFALMPSRSEPFGFVDIEFAHCGCPVIGSLVGGLGKTPGWYFKLWEGGDFNHIKVQLSATVSKAIEEGQEKIFEVGIEGICTSFPLIEWQLKLHDLYKEVEEVVDVDDDEEENDDPLWMVQPGANLYLVDGADEVRGETFSAENSTDAESCDNQSLGFRMEQDLNKKMLTGKEASVKTVFKSTVWRQSTLSSWKQQSMDNLQQSKSPSSQLSRLKKTMEEKVKKKLLGRTIETWIICILSILMPSHSTLIYAKAIVWASAYGWGENFIVGLYAIHTLAFAIGCLLWIQIMQRIPIGKCVCISAVLHMVYFVYFAPISNYGVALAMSFATGLISSASGPVFTAAMFFDEWDGSLRSKVRNYGWLEGSRTCFSGIVQGLIINNCLMISPPNEGQDFDEVKFNFSTTLQNIYGFVAFSTILGAGILILGMKREMNTMILPKVPLSGIKSFQAYPLLALSHTVEGFISYPTLFLVSFLLLDGYYAKKIGLWLQISSSAQGVAIYFFATVFNRYMEGRKCIGIIATFLINPVVLQALIMLSASNFSANGILVLLTLSSFLMKIKEGLVSILKLHVLPSRWKVVTFSAYELFFANVAAALSPYLIRSLANAMSLSLGTVGPGSSAEASALTIFYSILPFVAISTTLQLFANRYTFKDMPEVYTKPSFLNTDDNLTRESSMHSTQFTEVPEA